MRSPKNPISPSEAKHRIETLCSTSEQSTFDVTARMRRWGLSTEEIFEIVEDLKDRKFINDRRYAISFARDRIRLSRWGRMKVRLFLRAKGINEDYVEEAMRTIEEDEYLNILKLVMRAKARMLGTKSQENNTKLYRFAIGRGFETPLITKMLKRGGVWKFE